MSTFPRSLLQMSSALLHMAAIPLCFLAGALLYEPAALMHLMQAGDGIVPISEIKYFNIVICTAILLGVMTISRIPLLWVLRGHLKMDLWRYAFWCLMEIAIGSAFCGMFLCLMDHSSAGGYFSYFGRSVSCSGSLSVFPYLIITLIYMVIEKQAVTADEGTRLKFYDNRHQLKFIVESSAVLYIESNENYIIIHYLENGIEKRYQLRNSMKNIEPLCEKAGFARTHRCYIVNPRHVKMIRKDPGGGNVADLGLQRDEGIPISKKYYDSIAAIL